MLIVSSTDGYCSIVTFAVGELGVVYEPRKETPNKEEAGEDTAGTAKVVFSEGTDKPEDSLSTHDTAVQSCASEIMLDHHRCDKTSEQSPKRHVSEEAKVSSGSEEKSGYVHIPDLQKTEHFKTNSCGISECLPKQEKTPRRTKPILLSSPQKVLAKSLDSSDVSERKRELSLVRTSKLGDVSERTPPASSQCSPYKKRISEYCNTHSELSSCVKLLPATDETLISDTPSHNLTKEVSGETSEKMDTVESCNIQNEGASYETTCTETDSVTHKNENTAISSSEPESIEMISKGSLLTERRAFRCDSMETNISATAPASPLAHSAMPGQDKRTPRRVQLVTLSSPKSKKKLL
jgi:hypothetical protein